MQGGQRGGGDAYPRGTGFELVSCLKRSVDVLAEYSSSKTICGVVGCLDNLYTTIDSQSEVHYCGGGNKRTIEVFELNDDADWTEDLLLDNLHLWFHVSEECRVDKVSLVSETITTEMDLGTFGFPGVNVGHDTLGHVHSSGLNPNGGLNGTYVKLNLRDLWTLVDSLAKGITQFDRSGPFGKPFKELIVDAFLDEDTSPGTASLTVIPASRLSK